MTRLVEKGGWGGGGRGRAGGAGGEGEGLAHIHTPRWSIDSMFYTIFISSFLVVCFSVVTRCAWADSGRTGSGTSRGA